jgi:hypothetical protein
LAAAAQYLPVGFLSINLNGSKLLVFLLSVLAGKYLALYSFVFASDYLSHHLQQCGLLVNRLLAIVLLAIGISQAWSGLSLYLGS